MADLFEAPPGLPAELERGLDLLASSPPLWPSAWRGGRLVQWAAVVVAVRAFAERWDHQARGAGFSDLELYGLHRHAPSARLSCMGAAFVLARSGWHAVAIEPGVIHVATTTGGRLRVFRREQLEPEAALAWSLCLGGQQITPESRAAC